jgi:septin family protein
MSSDEDWGLMPKGNLDPEGNSKIHRISSTSTIKSIYIETPSHSPASSSIQAPGLHLIAQARMQLLLEPIDFNIIILGDSNIGKTSFIHSILAKYFNAISPELNGKKSVHSTKNILENVGIFSNSDTELRVNLIDTPGYGFYSAKEKWLESIIKYIIKRAYNYKVSKKFVSTGRIFDTRIHLGLYFIEGPRCKESDIDLMHKLQRYVYIIPVLARADTYNKNEIVQVKLNIISQCSLAGINFFDIGNALRENINEISGSLLSPVPPFAIISGGDLCRKNGEVQFVRKYSWGLCDIHSKTCSDFQLLCKLLFGHFVIPAIKVSKALNKTNAKSYKKKEKKAKTQDKNIIKLEKINWIANILGKALLRML